MSENNVFSANLVLGYKDDLSILVDPKELVIPWVEDVEAEVKEIVQRFVDEDRSNNST